MMKFEVVLERNREDRDRYVTLVKYERDAMGNVVPYRWTYEMVDGHLLSTRIQRLLWSAIKRERHARTIRARGQGVATEAAA